MMIVRLFCPKCAHAVLNALVDYVEIDVPLPVSTLKDDGVYEVVCGRGHTSIVRLLNLKFELLFEMGLNALVDGYGREAVSSFAAALERFYEFYWRVAMRHFSVPAEVVDCAWKSLSRQSERQLGAYISTSLLLERALPRVLSPNKEVEFRNEVIHKGYIPSIEQATDFGDVVMILINGALTNLRLVAPQALKETYESLLPKNLESTKADEITGAVNILNAVDVMHPPKPCDGRSGTISDQFARILSEREPKKLALLSKEEMKRRSPSSIKEQP